VPANQRTDKQEVSGGHRGPAETFPLGAEGVSQVFDRQIGRLSGTAETELAESSVPHERGSVVRLGGGTLVAESHLEQREAIDEVGHGRAGSDVTTDGERLLDQSQASRRDGDASARQLPVRPEPKGQAP